jgi:sulfite exporter TauE/SafE
MKKKIKRWFEIIAGILLIILGILLSLPFIPGPGFVIIFAGIMLISPHHGKKILKRIQGWWKKWRKK